MIISIIGFMAAGKTTLGASLGKSLGAPVVDLDAYIEEREGKNISQIFADGGESRFRTVELDCLEEVLEDHISKYPETLEDQTRCTLVLSLGGGIVITPECRDLISRFTYCVYLKRDPEVILQHLLQDKNTSRPMLAKNMHNTDADLDPERHTDIHDNKIDLDPEFPTKNSDNDTTRHPEESHLKSVIDTLYRERAPYYEQLANKIV